jgi:type VI secretion system protein ImpL
MNVPKLWPIPTGIALVFIAIAWVAGSLLGLQGRDLLILRSIIVTLGLVGSALSAWYLKPKQKSQEPKKDDDLELMLAAAQQQLATSKAAGASKLSKLPVVLVLGPAGSTKTSTVLHSGLEPELLAGEVHRGDTVTPTGSANLWFAQGTVFVEAGGKLLNDDTRWARLARALVPSRLKAVFGRGKQAPRAAVVCFGCDELLKPGASEAVPAAARKLRARLTEVSKQLGVRLPVYVLFTKADRLPYFTDYVRSLASSESQQAVLGTTLPLVPPSNAGAYTERETQRLSAAFSEIYHSLSLKRLDVLPRESQLEVRAGAYEFPRELRKVTDLAVLLLTELCKPSQLGISPFLRGFYFTGVRPVIINDAGRAEAAPESPAAPSINLGATSVFNAAALRQAAQPSMPAPAGARKVPEWVFLKRVFRDVILQDRVALGLTGGGTRVNLLRRALLATAALVFFVYSVGAVVSFRNNRALVADATAAVQGVQRLPAVGVGAPDAETLALLNQLRGRTEHVRAFEQNKRPLRYAWGMYTGGAFFPDLRRAYFHRFEDLLWTQTRSRLVATLQAYPDAPADADQFASGYDALKAYLITTRHPEHSTPEFLTPELLKHWTHAGSVDEARLAMVRRQFDFYGTELPLGNPYNDAPSEQLVVQVRSSLHRFAGFDRFYQGMLSQAAHSAREIRFNQLVPGSESVVRNSYVVPAAFTSDGWEFVERNLENVDHLFEREAWVLGEQTISAGERLRLAEQLRARYVSDYVAHWQNFLKSTTIVGYGNPNEAAQRLGRLSSNQSPLLQLFALVSRHTDVDTAVVRRAFQPVHEVMPPGQVDPLIGEKNGQYMQALVQLHQIFEQAARSSGGERTSALSQAAGQADQVNMAVRQLAQGFSIEGPSREVGGDVQRLMLATAAGAPSLARGGAASEINAKGARFCQGFRPVLAKFPFAPRAAAEASVDEVASIFQPGNGLVANFYNDALQELLSHQGRSVVPRIGAEPQPLRNFVEFYNRAHTVSRAMFNERGGGPEVEFTIRPQTTAEFPEITVSIDGNTQTSTRTASRTMTFKWDGTRANTARITARTATGEIPVTDVAPGTWALFRMFHQAEWTQLAPGRYRVTWMAQNQPVVAEVGFQDNQPVFMRDYFANLSCVQQIVR